MNKKKLLLSTIAALSLSTVILPSTSFFPSANIKVEAYGPIQPPVDYTPSWKLINSHTLSRTQTVKLYSELRKGNSVVGLIGDWLPYPLSSVAHTLARTAEAQYSTVQHAVNTGRRVRMIQEQNVNWTGYGARTRTRFVVY